MDLLVERLRSLVLPDDMILSGDPPPSNPESILGNVQKQLNDFEWDSLRSRVETGKKSEADSHGFRESGNREFVNGNLDQALFWYNQAIVHAEWQSTSEEESALGLAYGNRAQVFTALGLRNYAIVDLKRAIALSKTEERSKKLLFRKLTLLTVMSCFSEARQVIDDLSHLQLTDQECSLLDQSMDQLDEKQDLVELNTLNIENEEQRFRKKLKSIRVPWLIQKDQAHIAKSIKEDSCFVLHDHISPEEHTASGVIEKGQLLCVERPVAMWPQCCETHCARCLNPLDRVPLVACRECTKWLYCSEHCESLAWAQWHRLECSNSLLDHLDMRTKLMLRALAQFRNFNSLLKLLSLSPNSDDNSDIDSIKRLALIKLFSVTHYNKADPDKLIAAAIQASLLIQILHDCPSFQRDEAQGVNSKDFCTLVRGLFQLNGFIEPITLAYSFKEDLDCDLLGSDLIFSSANLERHNSPLALAFYYSSVVLECQGEGNTRYAFNGICKAIRASQALSPGTKLTREEIFKVNHQFGNTSYSTNQLAQLEKLILQNSLARNHLTLKNFEKAAVAGAECLKLIKALKQSGRYNPVQLDHLYTFVLVKLARVEFEHFTERDLAVAESVQVADRCFAHCSEALTRINTAWLPLHLVAALEDPSGEFHRETECFHNLPMMTELEDMLVACDMFTKQFAGTTAQHK